MRLRNISKTTLIVLFGTILLAAFLSSVKADDGPAGHGTIPPRVDLAVTSLTLSPPNPRAGEAVTVTARVVNDGEVAVSGRRVYLYIDPVDSPPISATQASKEFVVSLAWPAGDSMTVEYGDFSFPAAGCGHTIYAWVDPLDRIAEVDEVNNLGRIDFCVAGGDAYEDDDTCPAAKEIPTDGARQERTFDPQGDVDWVKFLVQPEVIYTVIASSLGSQSRPLVQLWDSCASAGARASTAIGLRVDSPTRAWRYLRIQNRLTDYDVDKTLYALEVYGDEGGSLGGETEYYLPIVRR